jgi:hypothetical protein
MTPVNDPTTAAVQAAQIETLGESMRAGFDELKSMMRAMDDRLRKIENTEAGCFPLTSQRLEHFSKRLDAVEKTVGEHEKILSELVSTNRTLKWLAGIATAILISLLLALVTGQAAIVFH